MFLVFKLFKVGDFVEVVGIVGLIVKIGIFIIIMNILDNKEIIVFNGNIYGGNIINYLVRDMCCVDMVVGIGYDVDFFKVKRIFEEMVVVDECIFVELVFKIVVFELVDSSVNFIVCLWVNFVDFWGVKFDFIENVKLCFDEEGILILFL